MFSLFRIVLAILVSPFKSRSRLEAENAALRHQLNVLRREVQGRDLAHEQRSLVFCPALSIVSNDLAGSQGCSSQDARALALRRLSLLLALEVLRTRRAATDWGGPSRIDPADECRDRALGSRPYQLSHPGVLVMQAT
jgi:hypothetical protein